MSTKTKSSKQTVWVRRVVLVDGHPVGKGRPSKDTKGTRTCLYIQAPKGVGVGKVEYGQHVAESKERPYNPTKNKDQRPQFKRTLIRALTPVVPAPALETLPAVSVNESEAVTA